ncbi:hypothetical protein RHECNPAF_78005 [Rhizobium etli CNPAF512]|nr:hypothetical protein RHECNPAF_78005 [Rhizobium etli CNPAF512]
MVHLAYQDNAADFRRMQRRPSWPARVQLLTNYGAFGAVNCLPVQEALLCLFRQTLRVARHTCVATVRSWSKSGKPARRARITSGWAVTPATASGTSQSRFGEPAGVAGAVERFGDDRDSPQTRHKPKKPTPENGGFLRVSGDRDFVANWAEKSGFLP